MREARLLELGEPLERIDCLRHGARDRGYGVALVKQHTQRARRLEGVPVQVSKDLLAAGETSVDRDQVWITSRGAEVARYPRGYEQGLWLPPPVMRPEPPAAPAPLLLPSIAVAPPELADYAELCA
jgi:hypothetical protein